MSASVHEMRVVRLPAGAARTGSVVSMTQLPSGIAFGPFRLDAVAARLWRGEHPVAIQPRPLAVLSYLAARPGVVIGRDELIKTVWGGTYVTKAVLKVAVRAVREALGDDADAPRYIETVARRGYRFVGPDVGAGAEPKEAASSIVGRSDDFAALQAALAEAVDGARRVVFVSGEAGIGKTTLIDRFVQLVQRDGVACVARGQCLEQYGEGEPYLPILEAVGRLARDDGGHGFADVVRRSAPTWVRHLPAVADTETPSSREGETIAAMPARMLREMADALEVFTDVRPLVLVLEDLQWSDRSTVDLLACIARRRERARLLVVASLRPAEVLVADHPLRAVREALRAGGQCVELSLGLLSRADVETWLATHCAGLPAEDLQALASLVHERTDGNALFMVNLVQDLVAGGVLRDDGGCWRVEGSIAEVTDRVPRALQDLLRRRIDAIAPATRRVLEVGSVAGDEFDVATVAAVLGEDAAHVDGLCDHLASHGWLLADLGIAEWPDGSVGGRYRFLHALYRRALYEGIGASRRTRLHRAIGQCEETAFAERMRERVAALAMHFTAGRDHVRATQYHALAGAAAVERHAAREAVAHYDAALAALAHLPADADRRARELQLVVAGATLLMAVRGYAAPETERAFARARRLCDVVPDGHRLHPVLRGLISFHHVRGDLDDARQLGETLLARAGAHPDDRALRVQAHYAHGATLFHLGDLAGARHHLQAALAEYDEASHHEHVRVYGGYDPGVGCSMWLAWTLMLLGRVDEAVAYDRDGLALACRLGDAFSLAWAHYGAGVSRQLFGDWTGSGEAAAEAMRLAEQHGFPHVLAMATVNRGWSLLMHGDVAGGSRLLRDGVAAVDATGAALVRPSYLGMLAAADAIEGDRPAGLARVDEALALVQRTGERVHEATLLIARSRLITRGGGSVSHRAAHTAETCLRRALAVARTQGARLLELRATVALARHYRARGRVAEGYALLSAAQGWFADVRAAVPDVLAARQLLVEFAAA